MPSVSIKRFGGSRPRLDEHLLGESQAAYALDCRFHHGSLDAWREPRVIRTAPEGTKTTIQHQCCWLDFPTCVDYALGPATCPDQLFITGRMPYAERVVVDPVTCTPTYHRLGLPCPQTPPEVTYAGDGGGEKDNMGYSYAYQYANAFNERSALSKASPPIMARDGSTQVVSGWDVPDPSWGVTEVLIYRTVSSVGASMSMPDAGNVPDTTWMLVGRFPIHAPAATVSGYADTLETAVEEDVVQPPPEGLQGITWVEAQNTLAGFVGNRVYFSHNQHYHNWPYYLELDDNVCALVEVNNVIYAMTDGRPYVIQGVSDCKNADLRQAIRLPVEWPMVACGNRHVASLPSGAVYPTHEGLVMLSGRDTQSLLTHPLYAADDWQALQPHSVVMAHYSGDLFVFGRGGSFVVSLDNGIAPGWDLDTHSELSDRDIRQVFTTRGGDLMMLRDNGEVVQWNRGTTLRPYVWHSPEFRLPVPVNFANLRVIMERGATQTEVYCDGDLVFGDTLLRTEETPLPMWALGHEWQVRLRGTANVSLVALATAAREYA